MTGYILKTLVGAAVSRLIRSEMIVVVGMLVAAVIVLIASEIGGDAVAFGEAGAGVASGGGVAKLGAGVVKIRRDDEPLVRLEAALDGVLWVAASVAVTVAFGRDQSLGLAYYGPAAVVGVLGGSALVRLEGRRSDREDESRGKTSTDASDE